MTAPLAVPAPRTAPPSPARLLQEPEGLRRATERLGGRGWEIDACARRLELTAGRLTVNGMAAE